MNLHSTTMAAQSPSSASHAVSLKPKEHGAYAIIGIPIVTALVSAGLTVAGVAVAVAALAGFFAHEPLLVALGRRGQRARRETPAAKSRAGVLFSIAGAGGILAIWSGPAAVDLAVLGCLFLALISFATAALGKHRTLPGQLYGVVGLSAPCVPIMVAGGSTPQRALLIWACWLIGFTSTTLAVRGVIAAQKRQPRNLAWAALLIILVAITFAAASGVFWPAWALPMVAASWYLMIKPPPARHLKRVGWSLVASTSGTAILIAIATMV